MSGRRTNREAARGKLPKRPADPIGAPRPSTWRERALAALDSGDDAKALRICSRHIRTGDHAEAIGRGYEALRRPEFQRQLGRDPEALVAAGLAAVREVLER